MTYGPADGSEALETQVQARPYLVTGGRTRAKDGRLSMETVVVAAPAGLEFGALSFELARILAECRHPCSVAEVAARLHLPLTVALVLVGDLVVEGHLLASSSVRRPGENVEFIERLIAGVTAL